MKLWSLLLWSALVSPTIGQNVAPANNPGPHPLSRTEVHFRLYRNYLIVVKGSLGILNDLNFLVDTGANPTAVDQRVARKLALRGQVKKLDLLDQNVLVEAAVLPTLQLGPIRADSLSGIVQDLSSIEKDLGVRIDAIVGFGVLGAESFAIDYEAKKIIFGAVDAWPFAVPLDTAPPKLTVLLRVGDQNVRLLLDTGAQDVLLFECSLHGRMRELPTHGVKQSSSSENMPFDTQEALLSEVRLGAADLGLVRVSVVPGKQSCGWDFGGVMGMSALGLRKIAFDFERKVFCFRK